VLGHRRLPSDSWDYMLDHDKRIGYIRLTAFSRDTARDLRKALEELQGLKLRGLIVDLRFNPGGLLNSAIEVSDLFISKGRIVSTSGRNSPERTWDARGDGTFGDFRWSFSRTASAPAPARSWRPASRITSGRRGRRADLGKGACRT